MRLQMNLKIKNMKKSHKDREAPFLPKRPLIKALLISKLRQRNQQLCRDFMIHDEEGRFQCNMQK